MRPRRRDHGSTRWSQRTVRQPIPSGGSTPPNRTTASSTPSTRSWMACSCGSITLVALREALRLMASDRSTYDASITARSFVQVGLVTEDEVDPLHAAAGARVAVAAIAHARSRASCSAPTPRAGRACYVTVWRSRWIMKQPSGGDPISPSESRYPNSRGAWRGLVDRSVLA